MASSLRCTNWRVSSSQSSSGTIQTEQQPQIVRQRHVSNRPPRRLNHGRQQENAIRSPSPYAPTFATLLEGPLLMPASASMFVQYPTRSPSLIERLDKPLPALPKEALPQQSRSASSFKPSDEIGSEESIAELYSAYRPMLRTPSPNPSQRQPSPKSSSIERHSNNGHQYEADPNIRRLPSWRPSMSRRKSSARRRRFPFSQNIRNSTPVRPSPLRQSRNITETSTEYSESASTAHPYSTPAEPLLLHPPSPLTSPPRRKPLSCWKTFKFNMRKAFMTEEAFEEYHEEGWQMHDGFRQLNPNYRTGREGADRFGKMEFMVWSSKNK